MPIAAPVIPAEGLRITLPRPHDIQAQVLGESARFNVVACGRRWGKTTLGLNRLIEPALAGKPVGWFAPTYKMLVEPWREVKNILAPLIKKRDEQQHRLELLTDGVVDMWSLDSPDTSRGRAYARVVVDEAAMVRALKATWDNVIRPTLTDFVGDAWFLSTPKGLNDFYIFYMLGEDPEQADWKSWKFPTISNPYILPSEIGMAQRGLPEQVFAQEYLAEFLADGVGVFRRVVEAAVARPQEHRIAGHSYVFGVDWGKWNDFTVISVMDEGTHSAGKGGRGPEQVWLERFNRIDYEFQVARLRALSDRFKPRAIVAERNSMGEPLIEHLARKGLPVFAWHASQSTKAQVVEALSLALEKGDLKILNDKVQIGELLAYTAERLPSGLLRYGAPEGMHDDTVIALALSYAAAQVRPQQLKEYNFSFGEDVA